MSTNLDPRDLEAAAASALRFVGDGMTIGLGSGRAAEAFIRALGAAGLRVRGVPTSVRSERVAREAGVSITNLEKAESLDAAFDGADEVAPDLGLIKGLGGALVRERVVAAAATRFVVLVTADKLVPRLGTRSPVPVEVVAFALAPVTRSLERLGATVTRRMAEGRMPFATDNGNPILDARFAPMDDPAAIEARIRALPGVIDTGLFLGMAERVIVGEGGAAREQVRGAPRAG